MAFDYHYETHSTDSKGHRETQHHYFSFFLVQLPVSFPELVIVVMGLLVWIGGYMGYRVVDLLRFRELASGEIPGGSAR